MATTDPIPLVAFIVLLFPMLYFFLSTPSFFFFKFSDPTVSWMMRGLLNTYFLSIAGCCALVTVAFLAFGRPGVALGAGSIGALAFVARGWFLRRVDMQIRASSLCDVEAPRRLRRLHVGGMVYNVVQFAVLVLSIPFVFGTAAA